MSFETKKLNRLLWAEIGLNLFALVIGLSLGIPLLFLPFPETINVEYMDKYMIAEGQGTYLILATTLVFVLFPTLISLFVISCISGYQVIFVKNVINKNLKRQTKFFYICLFILNLLLPMAFAPILMSLNKHENSSLVYTIINSQLTANQTKRWKSFAIVSAIVLALIGPLTIFGLMARKYDTPNRQQDLIDMYTLSEKEPNTMTLYFDRGYGLLYNLLFLVDWVIFKDQSFIEQFPEFTSYGQSMTHSSVTNGSNPSINGSWYFLPELKNTSFYNQELNLNYEKLNMNDWFRYSYYSGFNMFKKYGYENVAMFSNPYYDTKTYQRWTNDIKLQNELNEMFNKQKLPSDFDVKVMDVSVAKNNYFLTNDRSIWKDEVRLLRYFASSTNEVKPNPLNNEEYSYGNNQFITLDNGKEVNIN